MATMHAMPDTSCVTRDAVLARGRPPEPIAIAVMVSSSQTRTATVSHVNAPAAVAPS
jgi:hypothetical protein